MVSVVWRAGGSPGEPEARLAHRRLALVSFGISVVQKHGMIPTVVADPAGVACGAVAPTSLLPEIKPTLAALGEGDACPGAAQSEGLPSRKRLPSNMALRQRPARLRFSGPYLQNVSCGGQLLSDPMPCRERLRTLALRRGEVLGQTLDPTPVDLPGRRAKSLLRIRLARGELLDLLLGNCKMLRFGRPRPAVANNL